MKDNSCREGNSDMSLNRLKINSVASNSQVTNAPYNDISSNKGLHMKKLVLGVVLATLGLTSAVMAEGDQIKSQYSYKYQQKQEAQAKNRYQYKNKNAYQGTNPNMGSMGSMHSPAMRMGGGGRNR